MNNWTFTDDDAAAARSLQGFLPDRLLDAHAHLYRQSDLNLPPGSLFAQGPAEVTADVWRQSVGRLVGPERLQGGLFLGVPFCAEAGLDRINSWLLAQLEDRPLAKGMLLVAPGSDRQAMERLVEHPRCAGFKPYHVFSAEPPTFQAAPESFIPEWVWPLAQAHGLAITLHLVRDAALADPANAAYIRDRARRFPNARLILAHAARGFHAPNTARGLAALEGLDNVWFDTSAICESAALVAILEAFGPRRLLWGTDFPVSETRGTCVTAGDGFVWLQPGTLDWTRVSPACRPWPVGLESLRALRAAAESVGLNAEDLRDIGAGNLGRLLGFDREAGTRTQDLYRHARQRIPGGTQLLSKRPEMLAPGQWPAYFREARGCETWDLDGRHYFDLYSSGIGACLLGFRHPAVTRAVRRRLTLGSMCTLNPPEEVELADRLCALHPWAEQARFTRSGGEACAVAVRIARATTDRSVVALCGYHGWSDWYLAANLGGDDALRGHLLPGLDPLGVPRELRGTAEPFLFDNREAFQAILDRCGDRLAAVIMEPCRGRNPAPGFLEFVRDGAHRHGALLIFDEITIGWRLACGGAHLRLGVQPDLAVFAKALGNGHPIGAVIGTAAAMAGAQGSFISSTYWTESIGPAAALATLEVMRETDVPAFAARQGRRVQEAWRDAAARHGVPIHTGDGFPCLPKFRFEHEQAEALRTLYTQLMLRRGFLAGAACYVSLAHTDEVIDRYREAMDPVFEELGRAIRAGDVTQRLAGPVAHGGFRRLL